MQFQPYNQLGVMHGGNQRRRSHGNRSSMIWGINGRDIPNSLISLSICLSIVAQQYEFNAGNFAQFSLADANS
jgi:hypothetical protein